MEVPSSYNPQHMAMFPGAQLRTPFTISDEQLQLIAKSTVWRNKRLECSYCSKSFTSRANLLGHLRAHWGLQPFLCPSCPQRFRRKSDLRMHQKKHNSQPSYSCSTCGKAYTRTSSLHRHLREHQNQALSPHIDLNQRESLPGTTSVVPITETGPRLGISMEPSSHVNNAAVLGNVHSEFWSGPGLVDGVDGSNRVPLHYQEPNPGNSFANANARAVAVSNDYHSNQPSTHGSGSPSNNDNAPPGTGSASASAIGGHDSSQLSLCHQLPQNLACLWHQDAISILFDCPNRTPSQMFKRLLYLAPTDKNWWTTYFHRCLEHNQIECARNVLIYQQINVNSLVRVKETEMCLRRSECCDNVRKNQVSTSDLFYIRDSTPLHRACFARDLQLASLLSKQKEKLDVNSLNAFGVSALSIAVRQYDLKMIKWLLKQDNLNPNLKDCKGRTPLRLAIELRNIEAVELLVQRKDTVIDIPEESKDSLLLLAVCEGRVSLVQWLMNTGGISLKLNEEETPTILFKATESSNCHSSKDMLHCLVEAGLDVETKNHHGQTALQWGLQLPDQDDICDIDDIEPENILCALVEYGARIDFKTSDGKTILHLAVQRGYYKLTQALLDKEPSLAKSLDSSGTSALTQLLQSWHFECHFEGCYDCYSWGTPGEFCPVPCLIKLLFSGVKIMPEDAKYLQSDKFHLERAQASLLGFIFGTDDLIQIVARMNWLKSIEEFARKTP